MINQFSNEEIEWAKSLDPSRIGEYYHEGGRIKSLADLRKFGSDGLDLSDLPNAQGEGCDPKLPNVI